MIIRKMEETDVEAVFLLEQACFSDPWSRKSIRGTLREENSFLVVAEYNKNIVGYLNSTFFFDELNLNRIAVSPDFRKGKIGTSLIQNMIDFCKNTQIKRIMLEVRISNIPAQNLYKKFGFKSLGERKGLYQNPTESGIIMEKILEDPSL